MRDISSSNLRKLATWVLAGIILYVLVIRVLLIFSYSLDLDGAEFAIVFWNQWLLRGHALYRNPDVFPYAAFLYMPLYPYCCLLADKICGLNPFSIHSIFAVCRSLSFVFAVFNLFVLDRFIRLFQKNLFPRLLCLTLFLLLISGHLFAARPDSLQLLLFTVFLYFIFKYFFLESTKATLFFALLAAILAIFSKQDSVLNIFAILGAFCVYERSKRAFAVFFGFAAATGIALCLAYLIFGQYLFRNTVIYNFVRLTEIKTAYNLLVILFSSARIFPLALAVLYLGVAEIRANGLKSPKIFMAGLAFYYLVTTHLLMLRAGSYLNYSYPTSLFLIISLAMLLRGDLPVLAERKRLIYSGTALYILALLCSNVFIHSFNYMPQKEHVFEQRYNSLLRDRNEILSLAKTDTLYFLNPTYNMFFSDLPLVGGCDMHIDRVVEVLSGFQVHSRLLFVSTDKYDSLFTTGTVRYILADDDSTGKKQLKEYYPDYHFLRYLDRFKVYEYSRQPQVKE